MKFGENLHRYQVVEWDSYYIDYTGLKKLLRLAPKPEAEQRAISPNLTGRRSEYVAVLDQNISKVTSFFKARQTSLRQRLDLLRDEYGITDLEAIDDATAPEIEDLIAAYTELRDALKRLEWYRLVNLTKILGRLRQSRGDIEIPKAFYVIQQACIQDTRCVNDRLARLESRRLSALHGSIRFRSSLLLQKYQHDLDAPSLDDAHSAIMLDDSSILDRRLGQIPENSRNEDYQQRLMLALLHLSIISASEKCVARLLLRVKSLRGFEDHLRWLVIKLGRRKKMRDENIPVLTNSKTIARPSILSKAIAQLVHVIHHMGSRLGPLLYETDSFECLPLHYAVHYGLFEVCQAMLKYMKSYRVAHPSTTASPALSPDSEGLTTLKIAILNGDAAITKILTEDHRQSADATKHPESSWPVLLPSDLLLTAFKLGSSKVAQLMCECTEDHNYRGYNDESALYLAVRSGSLEYVTMLFGTARSNHKIELDAAEASNGWTPLILACSKGDYPMMDVLLRAGANPASQDVFGWTAKDHAAYRGYLPMAKSLMASDSRRQGFQSGSLRPSKLRLPKLHSSIDRPGSIGQTVPPGYSQVYVNLGALDTDKPVTAVNLKPYLSPDVYNPQREAEFQVEILSFGGDQSSHCIQLPILEDMANKPWRFLTKNVRDFQLAFNIIHTETTAHTSRVVGRAVALLEDLKQGLGSKHESLIRDFTVPIVALDSLHVIGTVKFYFLVVTPYPHESSLAREQQGWTMGKYKSPTIIGHRGIGQNDPSRRQLQIGENTVEVIDPSDRSVQRVIDEPTVLPISYGIGSVIYRDEDVQLTKDDVPVIYHDFLMSETGIDAPLHSLSLEQFMYISEAQATLEDLPSMAEKRYLERCGDQASAGYRQRSHSLNTYEQSRSKNLVERMKHTFEFKLNESKGFDSYKGNIRSEYIQASFRTLEELFVKLPESVGFDVEIKYPMLFEAHDWGMETYAVEANHLVDTILEKVYRLAGNRTIFFSSFSPEICILLSNKQHVYPVFFLTESGHIPSADARADSLQAAIHFAQSWHLPGVISRSEPLVMSPHLVAYIKQSGLSCLSWGGLNDDPENAKTQIDAGLDAIIVNSVNLISQTMNKAQTPSKT